MSIEPAAVETAAHVSATTDGPTFDFSNALDWLRAGRRIARHDPAWQAAARFLYMVPGSEFEVNRPPLLGIHPLGFHVIYHPHIDACFADGSCGVWTVSHNDIFAADWHLIEE